MMSSSLFRKEEERVGTGTHTILCREELQSQDEEHGEEDEVVLVVAAE